MVVQPETELMGFSKNGKLGVGSLSFIIYMFRSTFTDSALSILLFYCIQNKENFAFSTPTKSDMDIY